ncbi:MAG: ArsR/SmtB family transcription factor [Actinomycetota bacterium]
MKCCEPVLGATFSDSDARDLADAFKVIADPVRLRLVHMIARAPAGEVCACQPLGPLARSQPTVSHHLSVLTEAGLLAREKRGKWAWYRVQPERLTGLAAALAPRAAPDPIPVPYS